MSQYLRREARDGHVSGSLDGLPQGVLDRSPRLVTDGARACLHTLTIKGSRQSTTALESFQHPSPSAGEPTVLFQSIDQPVHPLAEAREGTIQGPGPVFVLLARPGDADAVAPEVVADRAAAGGFVAHEAIRAVFGTTAPTPLVHVDTLGRGHTAILITVFDPQVESVLLTTPQVTMERADAQMHIVQAWVPFDRLATIAAFPCVRSLRPPSSASRR